MAQRYYEPVDVARMFRFVREAQSIGQNQGLRVNAIQRWAGGEQGSSWCMEFVWMVFDLCYQGECPFDREQSCEALRQLAKARDWVVNNPQPGDLYFYLKDDVAHHVGIVTQAFPMVGIAGNTSEDGTSSNGDRVAEHGISASFFVRIPE